MDQISFDNLPFFSKEQALKILSTSLDHLSLSSDYYKAVFHLSKFPGKDTEDALISLLRTNSNLQSIRIAQRKAIEVLADFRCKRAMPIIGSLLKSNDPYIVENASWALQRLECKNSELHTLIASLLEDSNQNRRVLIQSLSKMGVKDKLSEIEYFADKSDIPNAVKGAAISAFTRLSGDKKYIFRLKEMLIDINDRQTAVQDVIDSNAIELLPNVLRSPISPFFKFRAVSILWPVSKQEIQGMKIFNILDSLILDDPNDLEILYKYNQYEESLESLIRRLFCTDFNDAYIALLKISKNDPNEIWNELQSYLPKLQKDYGALYFLILLFRMVPGWKESTIKNISEIILRAIESNWPDFMKFRPVAINALLSLNPLECNEYIYKWLDPKLTPYWVSRYATLFGLEPILRLPNFNKFRKFVEYLQEDENHFVAAKARNIIDFNSN